MGADRFIVLSNAVCPTADEIIQIADILQSCWTKQLRSASVVTIDEAIFGYCPSEKKAESNRKNWEIQSLMSSFQESLIQMV